MSFDAPAEATGNGFDVRVRVRNTGDRRGKHVVQVYASRPGSSVARPERWLAGFAVVRAEPGEVVEVPVAIGPRALRHWDVDQGGWAVEPGDVVLSTGPHAGDQPVRTTVSLGTAGREA
jgi:beta-glucosidase